MSVNNPLSLIQELKALKKAAEILHLKVRIWQ
jgi:hypothetical protein